MNIITGVQPSAATYTPAAVTGADNPTAPGATADSTATPDPAATGTILPQSATNSASTDNSADVKIQQAVAKMHIIEENVRAHEAAHMAAGGSYAGAAHFQTIVGPDGKTYITGGEVSIDMSTDKDPKKTIAKMELVIRAAMAPSDPSPQDYSVAAAANAILAKASAEIATGGKGQKVNISA